MYRKLRFKIVLIFILFIVLIMTVIGTILLNSIFSHYSNEFVSGLDAFFDRDHTRLLLESLENDDYAESLREKLSAYSSFLGIDRYRNFYILDKNGDYLAGSSDLTDTVAPVRTQNLISAINGVSSHEQYAGEPVMDYALCLGEGERRVIIYIADTQEELHSLARIIYTIIFQALLVGIGIAVVLSFLLSRAITSPIQKMTAAASKLAENDFSQRVPVYSGDEIGVLSKAFNSMADEIKSNLDEISGEREKLSTIFSYLKDGVVAFDSEGRVLHVNHTVCDLLGTDDVSDMTLGKFIGLFDIDYSEQQLAADTASGAGKMFFDVNFGQRVIDINFGGFSYVISGEPYVGYIAVVHDVTEHFELELARREFVANVSHELRTPLTGIKGAAETVMENPDMPDDMKGHFLDMIITESDRMTRIVHDLLMLSRLDNKKVSWQISSFSPVQLVRNRVEIMAREAHDHSQELSIVKVQDGVPDITGDKEKIDQVVTNLIQNAIKYTQDGGKISISVTVKNLRSHKTLPDGRYVQILVSDNGMGIPPEDIPHLFERFYRVEKARSSEKGGTGLGLSISKEIVTAHGGDIGVSSALDKGTGVSILLPEHCAMENGETNDKK